MRHVAGPKRPAHPDAPVRRGSAPRTARRFLTIGLPLAAAAVALITAAALRTPGWYRPPVVPSDERQSVRDDLKNAAQQFSDALMTEGAFDVHLSAAQINRWMAMRREIYPRIDRELPLGWTDPFLRLEPGLIRLAMRSVGRTACIASLDLAVTLDAETICLKVVAVRIGSLRVPLGLLSEWLSSPIDLAEGRAWSGSPAMRGDLAAGLRIDRRAVWPNGDRDYVVERLEIDRAAIHFGVRSLGPYRATRLRVQAAPPEAARSSR